MTPVPPPSIPCLRVRLIYNSYQDRDAGSRFYLSYSGSAPTAANCAAIAAAIGAAWASDLASLVNEAYGLAEVDVLDITTETGAAGGSTTGWEATRSGTVMPDQCAVNIEYDIGRRYRGGKPRMFMLPGSTSDTANPSTWSGAYVTACNTGIAAFFAAVAAIDVGAVGTLAHVNLSYYQGFKNITNSSGRERAVPQYRTAALVDTITGYATKPVIGSQRRRRTATSP
jgi:hypothetical protein